MEYSGYVEPGGYGQVVLRGDASIVDGKAPEFVAFWVSGGRVLAGSGQTVFMRNWPIEYGNLPVATPKFRVGVALLPGPSALGGADLAIANKSHYPRAAQALIQFLTADSSQRLLMERGGYAATRTSVYDDPAVQQKLPDLSVIKEAIAEARMRPVTPYYDRFSKVFSRAASAAISSGGALDPRLGDDLTKALQGG
jgi:multiple sugar transport system substrate-binding protein